MPIDPNEYERLEMQERAPLEAERGAKAEEARPPTTAAKVFGVFALLHLLAAIYFITFTLPQLNSQKPIPGRAFTSPDGLRIQVNETVTCDRGLEIEVNDNYEWRSGPTTLRTGETRSLPWGAFTADDGERFDVIRDAPKRVVLVCRRPYSRHRIGVFRFN